MIHQAKKDFAKNGWLVVDSAFLPNGGTMEEWLIKVSSNSKKKNMIFIASGDRFALNSPIKYNPLDFFNTTGDDYKLGRDFYRGYFRDFFEEIELYCS